MSATHKRVRVLIEATKLGGGPRDGCFRYTSELLRGVLRWTGPPSDDWEFDVYVRGKVLELLSLAKKLGAGQPLNVGRAVYRVVDLTARSRQFLGDYLRRVAPETLVARLMAFDRRTGLSVKLEEAHQGKPIDASAYDLVHLTLPQAYWCIDPVSRTKFVVTIHDCTHRSFPEFHLDENVRAAEEGMQFALQRNAFFLTNSETTRQELLAEYEVDPERVVTTPLAVDRSSFTRIVDPAASERMRSKYGLPHRPYFLALSTLEPRKNLINTARAFVAFRKKHPDSELAFVIAGKEGWKFGDFLSDQSARDSRIFFTGFVDEKDLPLLYSDALALLFVSHYEGFGLPALEGMSCGLPVIYGEGGALPEVVGDGGLQADPNDVDDIQEKLARIAINPDLREELSLKALDRADQFSWADTVKQTLEVYRKILG